MQLAPGVLPAPVCYPAAAPLPSSMNSSIRMVLAALVLFGAGHLAWNAVRDRALKPYGSPQPAGQSFAGPATDVAWASARAPRELDGFPEAFEATAPAPPSLLMGGAATRVPDTNACVPEIARTARPRFVAALGESDLAAGPRRGSKVLNVEPGERLPMVLLGFNPELPSAVRQAGQQIGGEFSRTLEMQADAQAVPARVWDSARARADEQFRALYGNDEFNQAGIESAMDALASLRSPGT